MSVTPVEAGEEQSSAARERLRVLFLACHLPYPTISGGRKREFELLSRIGRSVDVDLCVASKTYEEDLANARHLEGVCRNVEVFPAEPPERIDPSVPWQVQRHRSPSMSEFVARAIADVDLLHLEGYYLAQHLPGIRPVPAVLVEQNVEYLLCRQRLENAQGPDKGPALLDYLKALECETAAWRSVDHLAAVTHEDALHIRDATDAGVAVVPDGVDVTIPTVPHPDVSSPNLVFVANFAYQPNVDAAVYLCRTILPLVALKVPEVRLWLVGNSPPDIVRDLTGERVIVTGRVPSVEPYLYAADVVVCPLRVGGGIKVKILEAMARGRAIVTTSVGTQGLGTDIPVMVRDDPGRFAAAATRLLKNPRARQRLQTTAAEFARQLPNWDEAATSLLTLYQRAVGANARERGLATPL